MIETIPLLQEDLIERRLNEDCHYHLIKANNKIKVYTHNKKKLKFYVVSEQLFLFTFITNIIRISIPWTTFYVISITTKYETKYQNKHWVEDVTQLLAEHHTQK